MHEQPVTKRWLLHLKGALNKWRLCFILFGLVYAAFLLFNLSKPPIQWDEVIHLNGGSFLYWQNYDKFVLNAFYPPLLDVLTFFSFKMLGISVFTARLVAVVFSVLALSVVFELSYRMYNGKVAFLAAVFLGIMPGYYWLSGVALLETGLVFFTVSSIFFFYLWLANRKDRMLFACGLMFGLGLLTKYQMIAVAIIFILGVFLLAKVKLKDVFKKFSLILASAVLLITPWVVIAYEVYASQILNQWIYALQTGNPERSVYSERFPVPIFYFIEMVWPADTVHPISIFLFIAGIAGFVYLSWRRRREDQLVLIWFTCILVFFTLISNREWRYVLPLFPAIAISTSVLIQSLYQRLTKWTSQQTAWKKRFYKLAGGMLIILTAGAMTYSVYDLYQYVSKYDFTIEIEAATHYAYSNMDFNKSIMVLCPFNFFSRDMVRFYLWEDGDNNIPVFQYPRQPVDAYTINFDIAELTHLCKTLQVQYVFTYENGGTVPYYNSTINLQQIYEQLYASGNFTHISSNATFGENPRRIFVLNFTG